METKHVPIAINSNSLAKRIKIRMMESELWIETHGSGTLRKNKRIGFAWQKQYLHERICYEFGYGFEVLPKTRVVYNDPISEGDCHSITECGWFIERYMCMSVFEEDIFETKYIIVEHIDGTRKEGVGIIVKQTSFNINPGNIIFAIISEFDTVTKQYLQAKNPF